MRLLVLLCGFVIAICGAANAETTFPFSKSVKTFDLAAPDAELKFEAEIEWAATTTLVYIDWHFTNFTGNELFEKLSSDNDTACEEPGLQEDYFLSGRPNRNNNHLLVQFDLWAHNVDPFTWVSCEYFSAAANNGLRIRGFYYVADIKIATADKFDFRPLAVNAADIPKGFLGQPN